MIHSGSFAFLDQFTENRRPKEMGDDTCRSEAINAKALAGSMNFFVGHGVWVEPPMLQTLHSAELARVSNPANSALKRMWPPATERPHHRETCRQDPQTDPVLAAKVMEGLLRDSAKTAE